MRYSTKENLKQALLVGGIVFGLIILAASLCLMGGAMNP